MTTSTDTANQQIAAQQTPVQVTGVSSVILVKDGSAIVKATGVSHSALVVTEPSTGADAVFFNGATQLAIVKDTTANVLATGVKHSVLIVTEKPVGADAAFVNQVSQVLLVREPGAPVAATNVVHQALIVTEEPAGRDNVYATQVVNTILLAEPGAPANVTHVDQQVLIVTDPAPPPEAVSISNVLNTVIIAEPPAPAEVTSVTSSSLVITEGPKLAADATGVSQVAITQDLDHGILYANGVSQETLIITEARSRDPDRVKVMTTSFSYIKPYEHPSVFAERHRTRGMARGIACVTKFKIPTAIAAQHRLKVFALGSASAQEFIDPKELAAKIQVNTFEKAVVLGTLYPERVVSAINTPSVVGIVAQTATKPAPEDIQSDSRTPQIAEGIALSSEFAVPTDVRSSTKVRTLRSEVGYAVTALDPSGIRTTKVALQATFISASMSQYKNGSDIQSSTEVQILDCIVACGTSYQKDIQSNTNVRSNYVEAAIRGEYIEPNDPMFKSMIHLNRLKNETAVATELPFPDSIRSQGRVRAVKVEHCTITTKYVDPTKLVSNSDVPSLVQLMAQASERSDPAGIKPSSLAYQLQFSSAYGVDRYTILPMPSMLSNQIQVEVVNGIEMYDPSTIENTDRVYLLTTMLVLSTQYSDPNATKPNRRVSSVKVTRKKA